MFRIGSGHDTHRVIAGRPLILGGVRVPHARGLDGHSDADVVLHAVTDAILGALAEGDIGDAFPDTDPRWKGADSRQFLAAALAKLGPAGYRVGNLDLTIFAQEPKLGPVKQAIRDSLAALLNVPATSVSVKAKTGERVGHIGRAEALGCHAVILLLQTAPPPAPVPAQTQASARKDPSMTLQVYNTLSRKKEPFGKAPGERVTMYVCGPTVYKPSHVGHMIGPVIFDTVKRYLQYLGYQVTFVVNITDVDDKLITEAGQQKTTVPALAERITRDYQACLARLNVTGIDHFPKATDHIPGMVAMMERLIAKGYAYAAGGDVYFDVSKDDDYGKLCHRDPEQMEAGARIEVSSKKKNPGDFALWKGAKPDEPPEVVFPSPWGAGRPGWHIECSVMSQALLGDTLDIHGGGLDLQFPHHENELAQSESDTGKPFARLWMHNGLMQINGKKISKTLEAEQRKLATLGAADALDKFGPEAVRYLLLSSHYRSPIEYTDRRLEEVTAALQGFYRYFERYERMTGSSFYALPNRVEWPPPQTGILSERLTELRTRFLDCLSDDFNTAGAVGVLFDMLGTLNKAADEHKLDRPDASPEGRAALDAGTRLMREFATLLGLFWEPPPALPEQGGELVAGLMQLVMDVRNNLRQEAKTAAKDNPVKKALFAQTDLIRQRLADLKITLEDRPEGTTWRVG